MRKKTEQVIIIRNYFLTDATNALFLACFIVFVASHRNTASQYGKGALEVFCQSQRTRIAGQLRAHLASQNDELCKIIAFQKGRA